MDYSIFKKKYITDNIYKIRSFRFKAAVKISQDASKTSEKWS